MKKSCHVPRGFYNRGVVFCKSGGMHMIRVFLVIFLIGGLNVYAENAHYNTGNKKRCVSITKDLAKAKVLARAYKKPLALIFTGSDWCPYSKKLLDEIIESEEFFIEVKKDMVFAVLDFPELNPHPDIQRIEQNYSAKEEFQVKEFPLIILLDEHLNEMTRMGFSAHTSGEYGRHLMMALKKYEEIKGMLASKKSIMFSDLKKKYLEARELGSPVLIQALLDLGLQHDKECFFHLEKYSLALGEEREEWKKKILALNRDRKNKVALHLAVLEYQERERQHREDALEPLLDYTQGLGTQATSGLEAWRLHMLIAQHLVVHGSIGRALEHAELSLSLVPEEHRNEVHNSIKIISAELQVQGSARF